MLPTRGPVGWDDPAYIHRALQDEIGVALGRAEYVTLRGGRQTGKTTTAFGVAQNLNAAGAAVAYLDLEGLRPATSDALGSWFADFLKGLAQSLAVDPAIASDLEPVSSGLALIDAILSLTEATGRTQVVVMLDEVTAVPLDLQPMFFSALRALFNHRKDPDEARAQLSNRVSFLLIGTFDPDKLIDDQNSPFNISHDFDTADYDFASDEVSRLCETAGLSPDLGPVIHDMSGGHPYLTNVLIDRVKQGEDPAEAFDGLIASSDPNLIQLSSRLADLDPSIVAFLKKIASGEVTLPIGRGVLPALDTLFSAGLVRLPAGGPVQVRSRVYLEYVLRFQDTVSFLASEGIRVETPDAGSTQPQTGYDVGIVVALQEELAAVLETLGTPQKLTLPQTDLRTYYTSVVTHPNGAYKVVVTLSTIMGNVESALAAKDLMNAFSPSAVLVVGIAAGVNPVEQKLGDVLIAESVYYYELCKVSGGNTQLRPRMAPTSRVLFDRALNLVTDGGFGVHYGVLASGEQVVADASKVAEMVAGQPKLIGIEMESAGVCAAALGQVGRPEFIAIRGISDFADAAKDDLAHGVAAKNAASYMKQYLESGALP